MHVWLYNFEYSRNPDGSKELVSFARVRILDSSQTPNLSIFEDENKILYSIIATEKQNVYLLENLQATAASAIWETIGSKFNHE